MPKWDIDTPLRNMQPGMTFYIPTNGTEEMSIRIRKLAKELGVKIITRVVVEGGIKGIRIWRQQ